MFVSPVFNSGLSSAAWKRKQKVCWGGGNGIGFCNQSDQGSNPAGPANQQTLLWARYFVDVWRRG